MDSDTEFSLHSVQLDSGDRIFLYTDGVYDILNAKKERLGYEKFLHTMEQLLPLPQQQFWMGLSAFLDAFSTRGHRPDDIT